MTAAVSAAPTHDLWAAANRVDRRRARSRQLALGASDIGQCKRQAAYQLHRVKATSDEGDKRQAILGTWIHKGALAVLAKEYGATIETAVRNPRLKGHADAFYADDGVVEDIKTRRNKGMVDKARRYGPPRHELYQVHLYADLLRAGQFDTREKRLAGPQPVVDVRVRYLAREDGTEWVHEQPFDPTVAAEAWAWLSDVESYTDPDDAPRGQDGPGLSWVCDSCPFRDRCWPDQGAYSPQSVLVRDNADVAAALAEYDRARELEKEAKDAKARARKLLDASEPGVYGALQLGWSGGKLGEDVEDVDAMRQLLEDAGVPIPTKRGKASTRSISVTLAPSRVETDEGESSRVMGAA